VPEADLETHIGDAAEIGPSSTPHAVPVRPLERGEMVGRYLVLERLGVGGMGEVYAAYDPELDRKIAIKLLLPSKGDGSTTAGPAGRLLREAQAMAKLHHPNVVTVHDVGLHDIRVFVAMEYVDGGNLADWIDAGSDGKGHPHPWREVLARFLPAGDGLAAAHAGGLIHRDFKPANVLVGRDGSIRVADFGLARRAELTGEPSATRVPDSIPDVLVANATLSSVDSLSMRMTVTGAMLGTPAYMAPEQYGQKDVDARADQFSYCVALWEALYGERPFAGDNLHVLMFAIAQARLREPPSSSDVPAWIRRALVRGLTNDPARRWPDMGSLLTALRTDPGEKRRKWAVSGVALALVGGLAWGAIATRPDPVVVEPPCTGAAKAFGDALSIDRREAVATRFAELEQAWAQDLGDRLIPRLDAWAADWQAAWTDTCEDTHVRNEQSAELLDRRMLCLDRQRQGFVGVIEALGKADAALARKADQLLDELDLSTCSDTEALLRITPLPDDPAAVEAINQADAVIGNARGLYLEGSYGPALMLLESQRAIVTKLDHAPLSATFEELHGRLVLLLEDLSGGEKSLERAFTLALSSGDERRAAKVARSLGHELKEQDRTVESLRWLAIGSALVERLDDDVMRGEFEITRTQALAGAGDFAGAAASAQAAYDFLSRTKPDSAAVGDALYLMGMTAFRAGRYEETIERLEQARKAWASDIGPRHPRLQAAMGLLGGTARAMGDYAQAQVYFEEALAISVGNHGEGSVHTTDAMNNLAVSLADQGKYDEAIPMIERVLEIRKSQPEPVKIGIGRIHTNLAQLQRKAGRLDEAHVDIQAGEAIMQEMLGPDHPDLITSSHIRAMIDYERGDFDLAEKAIRESLRIAELSYGLDHPAMIELHFDAAKIALARGQVREAKQVLGPQPPEKTDPAWVGEYEFVRARIELALGHEAEALAAAERAKQALARVGPGAAKELAAVEAWLREHG
jgi:tetratricopeptide (TPR) repeat protein/tRNA A-37 threonylcarbamoyl transferase component Bud32